MGNPIDKYIVLAPLGQSNSVGNALSPYSIITYSGRCYVYDNLNSLIGLSGDHYDLDYTANSGEIDYDADMRGRGSFIPPVINSILQKWNGKILVTTGAKGGSRLYGALGTFWGYRNSENHFDTTTLYGNAATNLRDGIAAIGGIGKAQAVYVLWAQGEGDSNDHVSQANYQTALTNLIGWLREDVYSGIKLIIVGLGYDYATPLEDVYYDAIAAGQEVVAGAVADTFITARATKANGVSYEYNALHEVHYNAAGMGIIGGFISTILLSEENLTEDFTVSTTYQFGNRTGLDVLTGHKDAHIQENAVTAAVPTAVTLAARNLAAGRYIPLFRFNFGAVIPANFSVSSATLHLFLSANNGVVNMVINIYDMITAWGATQTTQGSNSTPSTSGGVTFRRAKDFNGAGGDADWASAGAFSASDYSAMITNFTCPKTDAAGTEYTISIPASLVQSWIDTPATYNGLCLIPNTAENRTNQFHSQESATENLRPYLVIEGTAAQSSGGAVKNYLNTGLVIGT